MNDTMHKLVVGDHVKRICAMLAGGHDQRVKHGIITHHSRVMVQVEWSDGRRAKYRPEELFYEPTKEKL